MDNFDMGPYDSDAHQRIERLEKRLASLVIASQPKGCVCPPRSEETCQNPFVGGSLRCPLINMVSIR